jgi:hypothetical protein
MTTSQLRNSIHSSLQRCGLLPVSLALACFAFSPTVQAVLPPPDGGYPVGNTAEGTNAPFSRTSGNYNTAVGLSALDSDTTGSRNTANGVNALAISAQLSAQDQHAYTFIEFDTPGFQNTFPQDINARGTSVGFARTAINTGPALVRGPNGDITTFEFPGGSQRAVAFSINPEGTITGAYRDATNNVHGYVRAPRGAITTFDAPGAGTDPDAGTAPRNINPAGTIAGVVLDNNLVVHGFVRARNGTITTFDGPGGGTGFFQGTWTAIGDCINEAGAITGWIQDANEVAHGFVRAPTAASQRSTFPVRAGHFQGTVTGGINAAGAIDGYYADANYVFHGFVRAPDGSITTFDIPGAGTGAFRNRRGEHQQRGAIDGYYVDASDVVTASCALLTVASTFDAPVRAQALSKARSPRASTSRARSRDPTSTITT